MSSSGTPTTTSQNPANTRNINGNSDGTTNLGQNASVYYGAVALAVMVLLALFITSRVIYIRRARRAVRSQRIELTRRGEEGALPTYRETTSPYALSYLSTPIGQRPLSRPVPPDHPQYAPAVPIAARTNQNGEIERAPETANPNGSAPPEYPEPPKYA